MARCLRHGRQVVRNHPRQELGDQPEQGLGHSMLRKECEHPITLNGGDFGGDQQLPITATIQREMRWHGLQGFPSWLID